MINKTKGIVLRTVKFGETSLVVSMYTELYGLQSYLVNGVRMANKKGSSKASLFQPTAILDLVVYHNEFKNLQRLKEFRWAHLYQHLLSDVPKNSVALFMIELFTKCLKEPETNAELFYFVEDALLNLDRATDAVMANFPLHFSLHLATFFGFKVSNQYSAELSFLDLEEGTFVGEPPNHPNFLEGREAEITSLILQISNPDDLQQVQLNREFRRKLLQAFELYYAFHLPDFGTLKTLPVMRDILS